MRVEEDKTSTSKNGRETVYDVIDRKVSELRERGINEEEISTVVSADLEHDFKAITKHINESHISKESIAKIVDNQIIVLCEQFIRDASMHFGRVYSQSIFYGLCLHLSAMLERKIHNQRLSNRQIMDIIEKHPSEYDFCMNFTQVIEKEFDVHLPMDEVVFITMFLCEENMYSKDTKKPVVLVAMHGESTASSIANVVNTLSQNDNTYAFNLSLQKDMQIAYDELKELMVKINQGEGILLLYDMGSLKTIAEMIGQESNIEVKTLEIPVTLVALDCARKASCTTSLQEVFEQVSKDYQDTYTSAKENYHRQNNRKVIITLCMTGKGGALQMKNYLEKNIELESSVEIIPLAVSDRQLMLQEVNRIKKDHEILYIIGTYDPKLHGIPFISISKLFETPVDKLNILLSLDTSEMPIGVNYKAIYEYLTEELPQLDISLLKQTLPKALKQIKKRVKSLSKDQEPGLFMHIACAIARIEQQEEMPHNIRKDSILNRNKRLYNDVKEALKYIEEEFAITFSDDEIASIIEIIRQI